MTEDSAIFYSWSDVSELILRVRTLDGREKREVNDLIRLMFL